MGLQLTYCMGHERSLFDHGWRCRALVSIRGNVTDEVWEEYIKNQKPNDSEDDFSVL